MFLLGLLVLCRHYQLHIQNDSLFSVASDKVHLPCCNQLFRTDGNNIWSLIEWVCSTVATHTIRIYPYGSKVILRLMKHPNSKQRQTCKCVLSVQCLWCIIIALHIPYAFNSRSYVCSNVLLTRLLVTLTNYLCDTISDSCSWFV